MNRKKNSFFNTVQTISETSQDDATCVPACWRSEEELVAEAETLVERVGWHLMSAKKCIRVGAIYKRERFLEAYRQILKTNTQLRDIVAEIADRFPDTTTLTADVHESIRKTDELANQILSHKDDIPFVRTAADSPS